MANPDLEPIFGMLNEINEDSATPKNVKEKIVQISNILKEDVDLSIKAHKALNELDEIVNDSNMRQFTRTQLWNVVSMLEKMSKTTH